MRYDFCVYVEGRGDVVRYIGGGEGGVSSWIVFLVEELVGRPNLGVESRAASEIGDFTKVTRGEFSMEVCGF